MNRNFQNNYRGGWNDMPFEDFSWRQFNYNYQIPHDTGHHYTDDMYLSGHHYADDMYLSHQMPAHYADDMYLTQERPEHYDAMRFSSHQVPGHYDDMRFLPHRIPDHYDDMRFLPHQTPPYYADNPHLTHQRPKHYADKRPLPRQTPKDFADKRNLRHQRPKHYADKRHLPNPLLEHDANKRPAPHQTPKDFAHKKILPHKKLENYADKMHSSQQKAEDTCSGLDAIAIAPPQGPMTSQMDLRTKVEEGKEHREVQNCGLEECAEKVCLPHQKPKPTIPVVATAERVQCEICNIMVSHKSLEEHYNGKKHRRMLRDLSKKHKTSNGEENRHIQNSQMNPVVQTPDSPHQTLENYADKKCLPHQMSEPTIPAVTTVDLVHCETCDIMVLVKCFEEHNGGKKHRRMLSKPCEQSTKDGSPVENMSHEAPRFRYKEVPAEGSKRKVRDNIDAKGCVFKEATGGKHMKMNNGIRRLGNSSKPEVNDLSNSAVSLVQIPELTPSSGHVASPKLAPIPAEGSSFELAFQHVSPSLSQESKGKEHHKFQNTTVEQNDQPQSGLVELNASAESMSCDFAGNASPEVHVTSAVVTPAAAPAGLSLEPSIHIDSQTEVAEGKEHLEVHNYGVETNDQTHSIAMEFHAPAVSMELHDLAGSMTNNQTEVVNSDSAAIVVEPLASALPDAARPNFEPLTEHGLHTETEPEVSEAVVYYESQNPIEETNIDFPQSDSMEIDADSEVRTETKTADGSPQVEEEMDVLSDESGKVQLPQVSVCLKCGDEGFEETLVYCNKCEDYALHRYCLDGPVIFTDEVIWLCEDCDKEEVDADYPDSQTADSEKGKVDFSEDIVTVADPQPIPDPIWKGSLQVFYKNNDKITKLIGHLSTLACPKVLEETRHLPNVLYAELLQRSAVWPKSFTKYGTNNLSIGLYFFPQNERVERYFDQLVDEMISIDLAIRARIEKSELLIFPSTMLPNQYKRFQSKYYLWGVFKRKQSTKDA